MRYLIAVALLLVSTAAPAYARGGGTSHGTIASAHVSGTRHGTIISQSLGSAIVPPLAGTIVPPFTGPSGPVTVAVSVILLPVLVMVIL